jgi:plasmid rolling circle replication initiator protein Rep
LLRRRKLEPFTVPLDATSAFGPRDESIHSEARRQAKLEPSLEWLADVSKRDRPWDTHHAHGKVVASFYGQSDRLDFQKLEQRINLCSPVLEFGEIVDPITGEIGFRLRQAFFCRVRTCPSCAWRRSLKWKGRILGAMPEIDAAFPKHRWLFLTLTVRNPSMAQLKSTIKAMSYGWRKMTGYKDWPAIGAIRSVEITKGQDGRPHPHFHALLLVPSSYFKGSNYLKHERWVEMWRKAMKLDYDPTLRIQPVKACEGAGNLHPMHAAVSECLKYSVKPSDLTSDPEWLWAITDQIRGTRAVEVFGKLKLFFKEEEDEDDLVNVSEDGDDGPAGDAGGHFFYWYDSYDKYGRRKGK